MLSPVRLSSVCRLPVTFVHPTQPVKILGNFSMPFGTMAVSGAPTLTSTENFTEIVPGEPLRLGFKRNMGIQI